LSPRLEGDQPTCNVHHILFQSHQRFPRTQVRNGWLIIVMQYDPTPQKYRKWPPKYVWVANQRRAIRRLICTRDLFRFLNNGMICFHLTAVVASEQSRSFPFMYDMFF
ncbi:unnamed protein product, partial [Scytosiphon promiscuus]